MSRVRFAAEILEPLRPTSVLDVGCRDAELARYLNGTEYHGADLFPGDQVTYVGDVEQMSFDRMFDTVVACDILEHLEDPSGVFDRLAAVADRHLLISLLNTYDLKSHWKFLRGDMGGKYRFTEKRPIDRHRWLMSRKEIQEFARAKAARHGLQLQLFDLTYGSAGASRWAPAGRLLAAIAPRRLTAETVFALFSRQ